MRPVRRIVSCSDEMTCARCLALTRARNSTCRNICIPKPVQLRRKHRLRAPPVNRHFPAGSPAAAGPAGTLRRHAGAPPYERVPARAAQRGRSAAARRHRRTPRGRRAGARHRRRAGRGGAHPRAVPHRLRRKGQAPRTGGGRAPPHPGRKDGVGEERRAHGAVVAAGDGAGQGGALRRPAGAAGQGRQPRRRVRLRGQLHHPLREDPHAALCAHPAAPGVAGARQPAPDVSAAARQGQGAGQGAAHPAQDAVRHGLRRAAGRAHRRAC